MNKKDMVIRKEYFHKDCATTRYTYLEPRTMPSVLGRFRDCIGDIWDLRYSHMTEAPTAKPEFELNNEIEITESATNAVIEGRFKHQDPDGDYWVVDKDGFMRCGDFARKVKPMVTGYINRRQYSATKEMWKVFDDAAEKIIAGDFNV